MKRIKRLLAALMASALLCPAGAAGAVDRTEDVVELPETVAVAEEQDEPVMTDDMAGAVSVEQADTILKQSGIETVWTQQKSGAAGVVQYQLVQKNRSVPVLMYHAVSDDNIWGIKSLYVSPARLREQLQYLKDNGYEPIFFSDLNHLSDYYKPVLITFDDGYDNNYRNAYPLFKEFNMKATFFVITNAIGRDRYMTAEQLREMSDSGLISVQSHSYYHTRLSSLDSAQQQYQMIKSAEMIEEITGKRPYVLSYPEGAFNETTLQLASKYYDVAVRTGAARWHSGSDYYTIPRYSMLRETTMGQFQKYVDVSTQVIFKDVAVSAWYTPYVQTAYNRHLMRGTSGNTFEPNAVFTRAQLAQVLYQLAGEPQLTDSGMSFTDVPQNAWYDAAVQWAASTGVTKGTSETTFSPNATVTREQCVTFLYRYYQCPAGEGSLSSFPDGQAVSGWARDACTWAVGAGILSGQKIKHTVHLAPQASTTRAQAAAMLVRLP